MQPRCGILSPMMKAATILLSTIFLASSASAFGTLQYRLDHMPPREHKSYLTRVLKAMNVTCEVSDIFDMGTYRGDQLYTISCGPRASKGIVLLNTTQFPIQVSSCYPDYLPPAITCFEKLAPDARNEI